MNKMLKFSKGNAKLDKTIWTFSILSGWGCPGAHDCLAKVYEINGKRILKDGRYTKFRCFSASQEVRYPNVFSARKHNFDLLRSCKTSAEMANLIERSLPGNANIIRVHVAGDFFSQRYFDAWLSVSKRKPTQLFYAYTKSLNYWVKRKNEIPSNFILTASMGGKYDNLIDKYNLRYARVVFSEREAQDLGLDIDHDDSHAMKSGPSFALLLHGTQPAKSKAAKKLQELKLAGWTGYSK